MLRCGNLQIDCEENRRDFTWYISTSTDKDEDMALSIKINSEVTTLQFCNECNVDQTTQNVHNFFFL